jgi:hypothetical protein
MAVARAARVALALAVVTAAAPAAAQAVARPVAIYPFARSEGAAAEDAQGLLESALRRAVNRTEDVVLSEPVVVRGACGPSSTAPTACLARLAGNGLMLRATLHRSERSAALAIEAVDGRTGASIGPVSVGFDPFIQNPEPITRAIMVLFDDVHGAARRHAAAAPRTAPVPPPAAVSEARPPPPKADLRAAEPEPEAPKAAPARAAPEASVARSEPRRSWMRRAAPWCAGAGLALLAGAATVSIMNESLSDELDRKYEDGTLTPADAADYDKVEQYNQLTVILAATGGALTLTSAVLFTVGPTHGGATVALAGRF